MSPSDQRVAKLVRQLEREAEDRSDKPRNRAGDERQQREREQTSPVIVLAVRHWLPVSPSKREGAEPHQRISAAPQVKPPPIASIITRSPGLMRPSFDGDVERERDRGGGGVAVPVDGDDHLVAGDAELVGGGVDDPAVGLMRHEPVDVVRRHAGVGEAAPG